MTDINSKVSPEMFQSIMLDEIAGRLGDLTQLIAEQSPKGNLYSLPITVDTLGEKFIILYQATIYNDGASDVYVLRDNNRTLDTTDVPIKSGGSLTIDLKKQTNKTFWIKTKAATAAVRIYMLE
jgi:choline kinase